MPELPVEPADGPPSAAPRAPAPAEPDPASTQTLLKMEFLVADGEPPAAAIPVVQPAAPDAPQTLAVDAEALLALEDTFEVDRMLSTPPAAAAPAAPVPSAPKPPEARKSALDSTETLTLLPDTAGAPGEKAPRPVPVSSAPPPAKAPAAESAEPAPARVPLARRASLTAAAMKLAAATAAAPAVAPAAAASAAPAAAPGAANAPKPEKPAPPAAAVPLKPRPVTPTSKPAATAVSSDAAAAAPAAAPAATAPADAPSLASWANARAAAAASTKPAAAGGARPPAGPSARSTPAPAVEKPRAVPAAAAPTAAPAPQAAALAAAAGVPARGMDRDFIARNQVVERYLSGKLPIKAATDFERYCKEHPQLLDEMGLPERVNAGLRLLEASGKPEPWQEAPKPLWQQPAVVFGIAGIAVALGLALALVTASSAGKTHKILDLQRQVADRTLDAATSTRVIRLMPSRSGASNSPAIVIGGGEAQLVDFRIDESRSPYKDFRVTIDRIDQGRVMVIDNLTKDSNGHLRVAVNSSAFGPGNYQLTIEGLTMRLEPQPDSWVTIGIAQR